MHCAGWVIRLTPVKQIFHHAQDCALCSLKIPTLTWLIILSGFCVSTGAEARWADGTVQQCLDLCCSVDLVYKLLIQEIQPVLGKKLLPGFYHRSFTKPNNLFRRYRLSLVSKICQGFYQRSCRAKQFYSFLKQVLEAELFVHLLCMCPCCRRQSLCSAC